MVKITLILLLSLSFQLSYSLGESREDSLKSGNKKKLIAFSSDATKNDKQQIFIMDEDGEHVKQVANMNLDCYTPRFSPDGKKIVFVATNRVSDYLYMIDLNDSNTFRFPVFITGGTDPVFSPDSRYLLYRSEKNMNNAIYLTDLETDSSDIV